jgi:uncharacterized alpha-E superfamily protein
MLSRVADSLYWMSRYLERAEHTARLIDVHLNLMLDASAVSVDLRWARVVESLGSGQMETGDGYAITNALAFDAENRLSIVSSISAARENARQVREQTSSEMWEQLNRLYHEVKQSGKGLFESLYADPVRRASVSPPQNPNRRALSISSSPPT